MFQGGAEWLSAWSANSPADLKVAFFQADSKQKIELTNIII